MPKLGRAGAVPHRHGYGYPRPAVIDCAASSYGSLSTSNMFALVSMPGPSGSAPYRTHVVMDLQCRQDLVAGHPTEAALGRDAESGRVPRGCLDPPLRALDAVLEMHEPEIQLGVLR